MTGAVGGEAGVTAEITAFANARIFDGSSAELREGCVRLLEQRQRLVMEVPFA
jgi:hypothetical protein